jgi:hypothetical protein
MSTATISQSNPITLGVAVAAFVAAVAFTGVTIAEHDNGSTAPTTTTNQTDAYKFPVFSISRPWHSGVQPGMP